MRLNLASCNCDQFEMFGGFYTPTNEDADIVYLMNRTKCDSLYDVDDENNTEVAMFGTKSKIGSVVHQFVGTLVRSHEESGSYYTLSINCNIASDDLPPPPREVKPVAELVDAAAKLFGPVNLRCTATFRYLQKQGYKSKIPFPIPLMIQEDLDKVTHIENAQFSRRNSTGEIEYEIMVSNSEDDGILVHTVEFEETTIELSRQAIRRLLDRAQEISVQLVADSGER